MALTVTDEQHSSSNSNSLILKTDTRGHMRTPVARREVLLAEFDRSGLSGKQFARLSGINYSTFQYWLQCRKGRSSVPKEPTARPEQPAAWLEAVVQQAVPTGTVGLMLHLPGGVRAEISGPLQIQLAVALVRALEKPC